MLEIGITGGIGSGKSTVARAFEALGYRVYYADDRARGLYDTDPEVKEAMIALIGPSLYDAEGKFQRAALAQKIFSDKALLAQVNAIVHPAVGRDYDRWLNDGPANYDKPVVFKEAAILFEAGSNIALDGVIMVYAPKRIRLQRVEARDAITREQVQARMANQWPDSRKVSLADFIIYNDGRHPIVPQMLQALQWIASR